MLLRFCRHDLRGLGLLERPLPWLSWGYMWRGDLDAMGNEFPRRWYILIKLPSYVMMPTDYGLGEPTWHQRFLAFKGDLPSGEEGWSIELLEC